MQFSIVLFAASALATSAITHIQSATTTQTITSCDSAVTNCPATKHSNSSIISTASTAGAAVHGSYYAAGAAALAAGALLM
jgi:hypothetical protein